MRYKKIMILAILLISLFTVSAVSAADNVTSDVVGMESQEDNVITEVNDDLTLDVDDNILSTNPKTFNDLNNAINGNTKTDIYLNSNYIFDVTTDSSFKNGVLISRAVTIHGNGHTINGNNGARIFKVIYSNAVFKDIVFVNGHSNDDGGAIYVDNRFDCTVVNCTFIGNSASSSIIGKSGGAMYYGSAVGCTFVNNSARSGGAMLRGDAMNCTFICNSADYGGAKYYGSAVNCTFVNNSATTWGGAMYYGSAVNCTFVNNSAGDDGGAMYGGYAVNCTFKDNSAGLGGAISNVMAGNCLFEYNFAEYGGAMSEGVAIDCKFNHNTATDYGGAVYNAKVSTTSQFSNNNAPNGKDTYKVTWYEKKKNTKSFTDLQKLIDESSSGGIHLNDNYAFDLTSDLDLINGLDIDYSAMINGNGFTIDGSYIAHIFTYYHNNIAFRDIVFVNAVSDSGGAVSGGYAVNCTFINNSAWFDGGAMSKGSAVNCTFINNSAGDFGGAMSSSSAVNCTFIGNSAGNGGAMRMGSAVNCTFINNSANYGGGAMDYGDFGVGSAVNCIFKDNSAGKNGGAMFRGDAMNCTFICNSAGKYGGAKARGSAVNCTFINNDVYDVDTENCTFIIPEETIITANDITTVYGVSKNLVATLTDVNGNLLAGEQISITLNNVEYTAKTNSEGKASVAIPTNLAPKTYVATIKYAGNEEYALSSTTANVVVNKLDTSISAVYNANNNEVVATLTNANTGKAISSANVNFNLNGATVTAKTNSKGQAKFSTVGLSSGTASISYAGNSKYKSSSTSIDITVKSDIIISAVYDADNNEVAATLTNGDTGKAVSSATVQINLNGETTTVKTNTKGQATISTARLPLGTNTATISYAGNSKYNPASTTINFDVKTKVIVTDVYAYSDRIVAKLTNGATGKFIANTNMIVEINGVKYNAKSDNKGQLTFNTKDLNLPSSYDLTISYRGNDRYTASSATVAVDLNKANMMITTNYHADKQKMVATLKNSKTGKAVSNANMIIDLNGIKTTYKSNSQGKITLPTADFAPGTYVGTVTYPGNARYNSISAAFKVDV